MTCTAKKVIHLFFPLCLAALFSFPSFSQKKVFAGYYISKNGDSVTGTFTRYIQWSKSPVSVEFLPRGAERLTSLTPLNTTKFHIDNYDTYISYSGERMTNPIEFNEAVNGKDTFRFEDQYVPVNAFVRLIGRTGNIELYSLKDNIRTNFFYRLNNEALQELKFKMYYDQNRVNEVFEYRQQLNSLFKSEIDKRRLPVQLENIEYTEESLAALLEKLTPPTRRAPKLKNPAEGLVVMAGVSINSFKVNGDEFIAEVATSYKTSVAPFVSIGYLASISRNFNRFFIYPHLNVYTYKNKGETSTGPYKRVTTFSAGVVAAPIINVGANLVNKDEFKYFIAAGGGMAFLINNKQLSEEVVPADGRVNARAELKLSSLAYNVNFSTGVSLRNKVHIAATYNVPVPVANFTFYNPFHSCVQFGVGYKL